jgi:hypothetical protein
MFHRSLGVFALFMVCSLVRAGVLVPVDVTGPNSNRIDIIFVGDGYLAEDLSTVYVQHTQAMLNHMFNEGEDPFPRYRNFFNVYRVNVVSKERGADVPPLGIFRDTALNAKYYYDGITERLLSIDPVRGLQEILAAIQGTDVKAEMIFATINDSKYGGSGGLFANYAGGNYFATEVALHEVGHSFAKLADEYTYGGPASYTGSEPVEANVTKDPTGNKWAEWLGYNQPGIGIIGAYEGAKYSTQGLYRPSLDSKMRSLGQPFDAVSREQFVEGFYRLVRPLDTFLDNQQTLVDPSLLWVDSIDPSVISFQWFVDGTLIPGATGESFDLLAHGFKAGEYRVRARAYDPTGFDPINGWVRGDARSLEQFVDWNVRVTVPEVGPATLVGIATISFLFACRLKRRNH